MSVSQNVLNNKLAKVFYYEFHPESDHKHHYLRIYCGETLVISFEKEEHFDALIEALHHNAYYLYEMGIMNNINLQRPPVFTGINARPSRMKYYWSLYDYVKAIDVHLDVHLRLHQRVRRDVHRDVHQ